MPGMSGPRGITLSPARNGAASIWRQRGEPYESLRIRASSMLTVSVIIPNYNHARYLRKRIESVLTQTYQDFEVILLDDCSTDESRSIIGEYRIDPRVRIELNEQNSGNTFKQWNKGVGLARGTYVWIA